MQDRQGSGPLESARLKLGHAHEHLSKLTEELRTFKEGQPYEVVHEIDPGTGERLVYAVATRHPDPSLALEFGDFVHNLAASLDHAVFGLSVSHAERSLSGRARRSIGFPIHADAAGFEKSGRGQIRFLPPELQAVIEADQPFHGPSEVARLNHPLEVLRELWNADKHRALLLATAKPELLGVGMHQADVEGSHRFTAPHVAFGTVVSRLAPTGGDDPREPYFEVPIVLAPHPDVRSPIAFFSSVESLGRSTFRHVAFVLSQLGLDAFPMP